MSDKTPPGLEPNSDGVNEWVRYHLTRIHEHTKAMEKQLLVICAKQEKFEEFIMKTEIRLAEGVSTFKNFEGRFTSIDEQIKELRKIRNNSKNNDSITFQWVLEKLALPILMLIAGAVITLLVK